MNDESIRRHKGKRLVVLGLKLLKVGSERKLPPSAGRAFRNSERWKQYSNTYKSATEQARWTSWTTHETE
jgi:hypothetical protein